MCFEDLMVGFKRQGLARCRGGGTVGALTTMRIARR